MRDDRGGMGMGYRPWHMPWMMSVPFGEYGMSDEEWVENATLQLLGNMIKGDDSGDKIESNVKLAHDYAELILKERKERHEKDKFEQKRIEDIQYFTDTIRNAEEYLKKDGENLYSASYAHTTAQKELESVDKAAKDEKLDKVVRETMKRRVKSLQKKVKNAKEGVDSATKQHEDRRRTIESAQKRKDAAEAGDPDYANAHLDCEKGEHLWMVVGKNITSEDREVFIKCSNCEQEGHVENIGNGLWNHASERDFKPFNISAHQNESSFNIPVINGEKEEEAIATTDDCGHMWMVVGKRGADFQNGEVIIGCSKCDQNGDVNNVTEKLWDKVASGSFKPFSLECHQSGRNNSPITEKVSHCEKHDWQPIRVVKSDSDEVNKIFLQCAHCHIFGYVDDPDACLGGAARGAVETGGGFRLREEDEVILEQDEEIFTTY